MPSCVAELGQLLATAAGDQADRAGGDARALGGRGRDRRHHGVRVRRRGRAAQHDRVADFRHRPAASIVTLGRPS